MRPSSRREPSVSARLFRALLALYPAAFRDDYRRELTLVFVDRYRDASTTGARVRLWIEAVLGILAEAPKEHGRMIVQDLRYALRVLRQHSLVTATIVITLGLGIGANTAMFSLLNAMVLRTLPVPNPGELFAVHGAPPLASNNRFSGPMYERLRQGRIDSGGVAAMSRVARVYARVGSAGDSEPASLQLVSPSYFDVLEVPPLVGRSLPAGAPDPLAAAPAVLSHGYWQRRFASAPDIVGRGLTINGTSFTVVGVAPPGFAGVWLESPVDVWVPLEMQAAVKYSQNYSADGVDGRPWVVQERVWWLDVIARTRPEARVPFASALEAATRDVAKAVPTRAPAKITLEPMTNGFSGFRQRFTLPLYALMAMAALVLLIACANVANLLLARAAVRQREMALRMCLGARRGRLLHQLLTESALLVLMAGAAALLVARWVGDLLVRTATSTVAGPAPFTASIDLRVLGFAAGIAFASVILFGLFPAWRATRLDLVGALKAGSRGAGGHAATTPARLLVIVQVALSLVLVTGTGLLVRSFQNLVDVDLGFDRQHLLSVSIDPRLAPRSSRPLPELYRSLIEAVTRVPGVTSAAVAMCGIQSGCRSREDGLKIEGYQAKPDERVVFTVNIVSPEYFATIGLPLVAGRGLTDRDGTAAPKEAVINRTLAAKYFAGGQAIGRRFGEGTMDVEIVGIVDDGRLLNVKEPAVPSVFFPLAQRAIGARALEVRTTGDPGQAAASVRRAIASVAPDLPIEAIVTMDERVRLGLSQERVIMFLTFGFGALALGLAGFGLFGVLSYAVARRSSEFGIRMALGEARAQIVSSIVRDAVWLVLAGFVIGVPLTLWAGSLVQSLFFGVSPFDWLTLTGAAVVLVAVGVACSLVPALRASRVDPIVALRQE